MSSTCRKGQSNQQGAQGLAACMQHQVCTAVLQNACLHMRLEPLHNNMLRAARKPQIILAVLLASPQCSSLLNAGSKQSCRSFCTLKCACNSSCRLLQAPTASSTPSVHLLPHLTWYCCDTAGAAKDSRRWGGTRAKPGQHAQQRGLMSVACSMQPCVAAP